MLDHHYIDDNSITERYLRQGLPLDERRLFEEHLVDCQECADRLMLAEMFLLRNGHVSESPVVVQEPAVEKPAAEAQPPEPTLPLRARFALRLTPWQLFVLFVITALLLVSVPAVGVILQERLHR